ncbi:hypothetical protein [Endozoicomonas sp. Mp262]|uniref:hypothetical protein n=1 Tax=Endozoicomonas sp. Mp262 TaxID=2919499 RepID=UPI0021DA6CA4
MKPTLLAFTTCSLFLVANCWSKNTQDEAKTMLQSHKDADYEQRKIHEVMSNSDHKDKVHINGKLTGKAKCGTFVFEDEHGKEIHIRVEADEIPNKGLLFNYPTVIHGEVIKVPDKPPHVDVEKIHYVF